MARFKIKLVKSKKLVGSSVYWKEKIEGKEKEEKKERKRKKKSEERSSEETETMLRIRRNRKRRKKIKLISPESWEGSIYIKKEGRQFKKKQLEDKNNLLEIKTMMVEREISMTKLKHNGKKGSVGK